MEKMDECNLYDGDCTFHNQYSFSEITFNLTHLMFRSRPICAQHMITDFRAAGERKSSSSAVIGRGLRALTPLTGYIH